MFHQMSAAETQSCFLFGRQPFCKPPNGLCGDPVALTVATFLPSVEDKPILVVRRFCHVSTLLFVATAI